ncbi:type II CAAX endopeptidase family protein [Agrilutibacter solisilvae]|uniref:CPBP family intramembrane metalloprotease n=1 Tax=Agrilutibacter solisilvae TaxID=2763317 RepID=A0A974XY18_9GAMM|nr:type II CAAX endopeptidase family protein [Lysobacter solisilvae]QSX77892.1 CPBP family intramembrane metalloprotease [Lysobacter solisilvae]
MPPPIRGRRRRYAECPAAEVAGEALGYSPVPRGAAASARPGSHHPDAGPRCTRASRIRGSSSMAVRSWLRRLVAVAAFVSASALAAAPVVGVHEAAPSSDQRELERVQAVKAAAYQQSLARYDAAIRAAAPHDAAQTVARCAFIAHFVDDEYGEFVDSAPDDFEACQQALRDRADKAPEAQVFLLRQLWDDQEVIEAGEKLIGPAERWPVPQRRALLATLSNAHAGNDDDRAGELGEKAARLGDYSQVHAAVRWLAANERSLEAARLLAQAPVADEDWPARERIEAALDLPDGRVALSELRRHQKAGRQVADVLAARVHLHAGNSAQARRYLRASSEDGATLMEDERFEVALALREFEIAVDMVDVSDMDGLAQNLARAAAILVRSPLSLFKPAMTMAAAIAIGMLILLALLPGLVLVPAHYRSLLRRARGQPALEPLFEVVGLRQAWIGLAILLVVPLTVGTLVAPDALSGMASGGPAFDEPGLFRSMLWGSLAGLLCIVPYARRIGLRQIVGGRSAARMIGWVLLAQVALLVVGALLAAVNASSGGAETTQTQAVQAIAEGGRQAAGPAVTLLLMALIVPVLEELVFRGLLLGGLARHIGFGWANAIQALVFAASHDDLPRLPFYLALGLFAGWLVKRTRSLGPAIVLHALNNSWAALAMMYAT